MKFGKQFEIYKIPEWSEFYFDYNGIKTVLKFIDKRRAKKKQLKKLKSIKAQLRRLSFQEITNNIKTNQNVISNKDEISTKSNKITEEEEPKEDEINPKLNQTFDDIISQSDRKPLLQDEKTKEKILEKTEKIYEAEDLSAYTDEEKLSKFLKIYKDKISFINDFFTKKLDEFENKLENSKKKMKAKNQTNSKKTQKNKRKKR